MKKAFLISAIFSLFSGTASAAISTYALTCPTAFSYYVVKIAPLVTNYYAV